MRAALLLALLPLIAASSGQEYQIKRHGNGRGRCRVSPSTIPEVTPAVAAGGSDSSTISAAALSATEAAADTPSTTTEAAADTPAVSATSAAATTTSSGGGGGGDIISSLGKGPFDGQSTWFNTNANSQAVACGQIVGWDRPAVAVRPEVFASGGGTDQDMYPNDAPICGQVILITDTATGHQEKAFIADECPTCSGEFNLDMSPSLFGAFADLNVGMFDLTWEFTGESGGDTSLPSLPVPANAEQVLCSANECS